MSSWVFAVCFCCRQCMSRQPNNSARLATHYFAYFLFLLQIMLSSMRSGVFFLSFTILFTLHDGFFAQAQLITGFNPQTSNTVGGGQMEILGLGFADLSLYHVSRLCSFGSAPGSITIGGLRLAQQSFTHSLAGTPCSFLSWSDQQLVCVIPVC